MVGWDERWQAGGVGVWESKDSSTIWKHLSWENATFVGTWPGSLIKTCSVGGIRAGACFLFRFILAIFTLLSPILLTALGDMLGAGLMLQHGPLDLNSFADYITPCDSITDLHTSSCPFLFFCLILVILSSHQLSREILWASPWNSNAPRWIVRPLSHTWRASNEMPSARN